FAQRSRFFKAKSISVARNCVSDDQASSAGLPRSALSASRKARWLSVKHAASRSSCWRRKPSGRVTPESNEPRSFSIVPMRRPIVGLRSAVAAADLEANRGADQRQPDEADRRLGGQRR